MKFLTSQLAFVLQSGDSRRNLRLLWRFVLLLFVLVTVLYDPVSPADGVRGPRRRA